MMNEMQRMTPQERELYLNYLSTAYPEMGIQRSPAQAGKTVGATQVANGFMKDGAAASSTPDPSGTMQAVGAGMQGAGLLASIYAGYKQDEANGAALSEDRRKYDNSLVRQLGAQHESDVDRFRLRQREDGSEAQQRLDYMRKRWASYPGAGL